MHWLLTPKFKVDLEIERAFIRILRRCQIKHLDSPGDPTIVEVLKEAEHVFEEP
jgi:hypothetical protein